MMDIDHSNNKDDGVRDAGIRLESELVDQEENIIRGIHEGEQNALALVGAGPLYLPNTNYGLPERNTPVVSLLAGRVTLEERSIKSIQEHDSLSYSPTEHNSHSRSNLHFHNGINGDADGKVIGNDANREELDTYIPKEVGLEQGQGQEQRSRRISIDDLLTGPSSISLPRIQSNSAISTPTSISPATPEDHQPSPYQHYIPGSIHSPVPLPLRPRSSFGTSARPISNRRPGPINTPRSRASPYLTSAARNEGVGLGINMLNSPSTPGDMHSHSNSPLGMGPAQSPGSMSSRRRKAPEWPELKSSRSHSFNQSTSSTPRDMYQTLKTPAALRVPSTAQLLSRPGEIHSPMLIPGSASGVGPMRRGIPPCSAPPLSARLDTQSPQIPTTPRRVHLLDVPRAKVISTLNERAGKYWFDPSSSDCRICKSIHLIYIINVKGD